MAYVIEAEKCTACSTCAEQCPSGAISAAEGGSHYIIDPEKCVDCAACEGSCPSGAIHAGAWAGFRLTRFCFWAARRIYRVAAAFFR